MFQLASPASRDISSTPVVFANYALKLALPALSATVAPLVFYVRVDIICLLEVVSFVLDLFLAALNAAVLVPAYVVKVGIILMGPTTVLYAKMCSLDAHFAQIIQCAFNVKEGFTSHQVINVLVVLNQVVQCAFKLIHYCALIVTLGTLCLWAAA